MSRRAITRRAVATVLAVGMLAAACGGDDDDAAEDETTETTTGDGATATTAGEDDTTDSTTGDDDTTATTAGEDDTTATTAGEEEAPETTAPAADDDVCTEDRIGGEITMGLLGYPPSLDPVANRGTGGQGNQIANAIFDTLMRYDQATDEFIPQVAESLEPNDDYTEWTLTLREGVEFTNGDPLTAEMVQASFARHQDPANRSVIHAESLAVTGMEVVDDLTLVFTLDGPWLRFPALLTHTAGMVTNQAVVDALGEGFAQNPGDAGVGPYVLDRWVPNEEIVLKAKTDWWGGPVCIQQLRFTRVPTGPATYDAFKTGEFQIAQIRDASVQAEAIEAGYSGLTYNVSSTSVFSLNHLSGPTVDVTVRQAIAAAIDPQVINDRVYQGLARSTTAVIGEASVHYAGVEGPQPDPARAAELVEQAKANGWDGNISLLCLEGNEQQDICLTAQAMMQNAGINAEIEVVPVPEAIPRVLSKNYEMASFGGAIDDTDPWIRLSAGVGSNGALNEIGYSSPEMDAALAALRSAPDEDAYAEALAAIQEIWNRDIPKVVYMAEQEINLIDESIHGLYVMQNDNLYFGKAYIEE